ncbi:CHASE domain-containing protein [Neomesorhizobium albiziae]|uniref:CHASE domain-containing protein n=1 Tax=Neomesorhizobium albiziae TaxID=335020 RepID=UPI00122C8BA1|nr:CHASE domain-containing protein [Mesorhizobium albiziae]GLS30575.1 histidine kinase [Mesorhizobium albiziae]
MKKLFPFAVFLSVALASLVMAGFAYFASQEAGRIKFAAAADDALARIGSRIDLHLLLLRASHAFFEAHKGQPTGDEFKVFVSGLNIDKTYTGLRGIGLLKIAGPDDDAAIEQEILNDYGIVRRIWPEESGKAKRLPIVMFEPSNEASLAAMGLDMYSDAARRRALDAAIEAPGAHATGRVQFGQTAEGPVYSGFLVFLRVDRPTEPSSPPAGILYAAFRANELFSAALGQTPLLPVNVEVFEGPAMPENLLFRSQVPPNPDLANSHLVTRELIVAGQPWTVQFRPTAGFELPASPIIPISLGIIGLVLAGAIAMLARWQDRAYTAVETLQNATEKSLLEKDLMLQEMKHRIKNSITRVLAMARQTASHSKNIDEFSASFAARLQAMAASQDMLTRSQWQKADLEELLKTELEQVFGKNLEAGVLSGPPVEIDEPTTQALGLTFHELATNALKYGDAGRGKGGLKVKWRLNGDGGRQTVLLTWSEDSEKPLSVPDKSSFGTKLIDMNITRELGGSIERAFGPEGLQVDIEIPLARQKKMLSRR